MGHLVNPDKDYQLLQQRLDKNITGAPDSPVFIKILKLLFSPEEAAFARQIPVRPTPLSTLSKQLNLPEEELRQRVAEMAQRGLVFDMELGGKCYIALAPVVIGFFEFTFMRTRENLPMAQLAELFEEYMMKDDRFARSVFDGTTQIGRSLVREEALPEHYYTEVLDWERASHIVKSAQEIGLSLCACRHKAEHLGKACDNSQETCLTFNGGARVLIQNGMAKSITNSQAMQILERCKESGLAQTADNVKKDVGYICNCCSCCCGMFQAIKTFSLNKAIVSSNWLADINDNCRGCGLCVKACPVGAINLTAIPEPNRKRKIAQIEKDICLGCGVCHSSCSFDTISMKPRPKRVFTPETTFDRYVAMAIERGKLTNLIFDDPGKLSHRALGRISRILEQSHPYKALMAVESIRSGFLKAIVSGAKRYSKS